MRGSQKYSLVFIFLLPFLLAGDCELLHAELVNAKLPSPRTGVTISYDGLDTFYMIGGYSFINQSSQYYRDILKYSLSQDTLELVGEMPVSLASVNNVFTWNDEEAHYAIGGPNPPGFYRFQEGNEDTADLIGNIDIGFASYHPMPQQQRNDSILVLLPRVSALYPRLFEFNSTALVVTKTIILPVINGYSYVTYAGGAQMEEGKAFLIFGVFTDTSGSLPDRYDAAYKYNIGDDRGEVLSTPILPWVHAAYPSSSRDSSVVHLFGCFIVGEDGGNCTTGIHRYDVVRNETELFPISGMFDEGNYFFSTTTFYVSAMNRLYIIGGNSRAGGYHDDIWYVNLGLLSV